MIPEITAATIRMTIRKSPNWAKSMRSGLRRGFSTIVFGPCTRSRRAASAATRPAPGSVASRRATASASSAWKRGATGSLAAGDGFGRSDIIGI